MLAATKQSPHTRSAGDIKEIIAAERAGSPFLLWRDREGSQQILSLREPDRLSVGRRRSNDVVLDGDGEVSRTHAELERVAEEWAVTDDGLSRNGTFVNGARVSGRRRLHDGDAIRLGNTVVEYRCPNEGSTALTVSASHTPRVESLTETQRRILVALCRPYKAGDTFMTPATNSAIAAEVFLSVDAVKTHLKVLFQRFEIGDLPQNQKRTRLVECAFQWGLVSERDL